MAGMNKIQFAFPVESVSRKMTLRKNTASSTVRVAADVSVEKPVARYMGAGVTKRYHNDIGYIEKNYMFVRFNKRGTAPTADEIAVRNYFSQASKLCAAWRNDVSSLADQKAAFDNHLSRKGVVSYGMTAYQFRFKVAYAVIMDGGTPSSPWPTN